MNEMIELMKKELTLKKLILAVAFLALFGCKLFL